MLTSSFIRLAPWLVVENPAVEGRPLNEAGLPLVRAAWSSTEAAAEARTIALLTGA
jgi:hypothetical protein